MILLDNIMNYVCEPIWHINDAKLNYNFNPLKLMVSLITWKKIEINKARVFSYSTQLKAY